MIELLTNMDNAAYYFFRNLAQHLHGLDALMQLGNFLGSALAIGVIIFLAAALYVYRETPRSAVIAVAMFALGVIIVEIARNVFFAHRPADAQDLVGADEMLRSFPARGVFLFTLAGVLLLFAAWNALERTALRLTVTVAVIVLILWAALSQLVLGLNFVTDVMAGLAGGLGLALLASRFLAGARGRGPGAGEKPLPE